MRETDAYTSPLDDFFEASDYAFELPEPGGLVLIVDDEESSVALSRSILEAAGYDVPTFDRAPEVLDHLVSDEPTVLVTDFDWRSRVTRSRSVDRSSGFPRRGSPFWRVVRIDRACAEKAR